MIDVLRLDDQQFVESRRVYMDLYRAHLNARAAGVAAFSRFFRYPDSLPNLAALRLPANARAEAVRDCCFERRRRGELEEAY